ncbi:Wall-associated receptor kinase [Trema orientale]|uniref:Wall-associated receptor kinase n=1 Tax=Trema orientale TaxID=63057 RepID=A0A2P5FW12_TREOI|nr:Wall-associated receptor kinase [Trema orientale]
MAVHELMQQNYVLRSYELLLNLVLLGLILLISVSKAITVSELKLTKAGCSHTCGSITIPYPFGTSPGCYYNESFLITCNHTTTSNPQPFLPHTNISILNISITDGLLRVASSISRDCYNNLGNLTNSSKPLSFTYTNSSFPLSTRNKFTAVGCDTIGVIGSERGRYYGTGCVALCNVTEDVINGSCSGVGCCQIPIPEGIFDFATGVQSLLDNHTDVHGFNPCGYAFVADENAYNFSSSDLMSLQNRETVPMLLDWAVGDNNCAQAKKNLTGYACRSGNSECLNSTYGSGYRCICSQGFEGNPYLLDGCRDIDECKTTPNPCITTCLNLPGSFHCSSCPKGYSGDGKRNGTGCFAVDGRNHSAVRLSVALGICIGLLVMLVGGSWIYWGLKKRKLIKLKVKFFQQNGGLLLQQQLSHSRGGSTDTTKVFTAEELNKATNNYDESRVLGQGGYGTVYKGILPDNKVVAIKKSKICDQSQIEQFINEVIVLSQINHRNVVKLLGCCLETEVPLLVYEFITNGTLSEHIHDKVQYSSLSWEMRLKIASETAEAIGYLHSSASMPIIHRDIKTANILLDSNYTAKVSDFGASRLVPLDHTQLTTLVQGTLGYLDPEYLHTSQITEKSDVYSFGVVLAELITGQKALSFERQEGDRNLAMYFVSSMKEDRLLEIFDSQLVTEANVEQLKVVANLAKCCLRVKGEERPTMKEVASELEGLKHKGMHPWRQLDGHDLNSEETEYLLKPSDPNNRGKDIHGDTSCSNTTSGFDSMNIEILKPYDHGGR